MRSRAKQPRHGGEKTPLCDRGLRISFACFSYVILLVAAVQAQAPAQQQGAPTHNIQLTRAREIADAAAVDRAITTMVEDAASCGAAQDKQSCACSFKDDLKRLGAAYDTAVAKHPEWKAEDSVVTYIDPANGKSVTINFPGVKRQLDACARRSP